MSGAILIVSRQNLHLTKLAVKSALEQDTPCDVLLLDNASTDGTVAWMKSKPGIIVIHQYPQISLAACWNRGIQTFQNAGYDRVLVINNDVEIRPDTYRMLSTFNGCFITGVSVDRRERMGTPGDRTLADLAKTTRKHPDFSCWMIDKLTVETVGYFNEEYYPAYAEDCEYHVRMHRKGITALCVDMPFLHHGAATLNSSDEGEATRIRRGADANRERFRRMYGCLPGTPEYLELFK